MQASFSPREYRAALLQHLSAENSLHAGENTIHVATRDSPLLRDGKSTVPALRWGRLSPPALNNGFPGSEEPTQRIARDTYTSGDGDLAPAPALSIPSERGCCLIENSILVDGPSCGYREGDGTIACSTARSTLPPRTRSIVMDFIDNCVQHDVPEDTIIEHVQFMVKSMQECISLHAALHSRVHQDRIREYALGELTNALEREYGVAPVAQTGDQVHARQGCALLSSKPNIIAAPHHPDARRKRDLHSGLVRSTSKHAPVVTMGAAPRDMNSSTSSQFSWGTPAVAVRRTSTHHHVPSLTPPRHANCRTEESGPCPSFAAGTLHGRRSIPAPTPSPTRGQPSTPPSCSRCHRYMKDTHASKCRKRDNELDISSVSGAPMKRPTSSSHVVSTGVTMDRSNRSSRLRMSHSRNLPIAEEAVSRQHDHSPHSRSVGRPSRQQESGSYGRAPSRSRKGVESALWPSDGREYTGSRNVPATLPEFGADGGTLRPTTHKFDRPPVPPVVVTCPELQLFIEVSRRKVREAERILATANPSPSRLRMRRNVSDDQDTLSCGSGSHYSLSSTGEGE